MALTVPNDEASVGGLARTGRALLQIYVFALPLMQPPIRLFGFNAIAADIVFAAILTFWAAAWMRGELRRALPSGYGAILLYGAALALSYLAGSAEARHPAKVAIQAYLLLVPLVAATLVRTRDDLRQLMLAWLAGAGLVGVAGLLSLGLFFLAPQAAVLQPMLFPFGTLPPGDYPRLKLTFLNGNMLCNYLAVSILVGLAAFRAGWLSRGRLLLLVSMLLASAASTVSPGLGGLLLTVGVWIWAVEARERAGRAWLALAAGSGAALLFLAATMVTPILYPTAPFLIRVPGTELVLAPSARLAIWIEAAKNFAAYPWFGMGIGSDAVHFSYRTPSGDLQSLTDAHNVFLSIAAQAGIVGLAGLGVLIAAAVRLSLPWRLLPGGANMIRFTLAIAFLGGFVVQGLSGSFEDTRHLWALLGLLIAAAQIEREGVGS